MKASKKILITFILCLPILMGIPYQANEIFNPPSSDDLLKFEGSISSIERDINKNRVWVKAKNNQNSMKFYLPLSLDCDVNSLSPDQNITFSYFRKSIISDIKIWSIVQDKNVLLSFSKSLDFHTKNLHQSRLIFLKQIAGIYIIILFAIPYHRYIKPALENKFKKRP